MGLLSKLFKPAPKNNSFAEMLNGFSPIFSQFGQDIYASDVVQQAIKCIVDEMKKLTPMHVRNNGADPVPVRGNVQSVLDFPNDRMTTSEFLEKVVWQLFFNYNAFIIPTYFIWTDDQGNTKRYYDGLYPVQPYQVDFIEDASGKLFVKMRFANNYETTIAYENVIHIKYNYSINEFMGGNKCGQPDHNALLKTLDLNETLLTGVSSAMKSSFAINGVVKYNTLMDDGKTDAALKELETKLKKSESGFLPLDLKSEFVPIKKEIKLVDEATLKFIDEKILRNFGVPLAILTGDYTVAQYESFYQKTLEPLIISISQAFTKTLFTRREIAFGNEIKLYPKELIFMSTDQTLQMVNLLGPTGTLYENEKRVAFGMRPLPELEGVRMQSLNWVNVEYAKEYQTGQNEKDDGGGNDNGDIEENNDDDSQVQAGE